jgi:hypothetical protein
MHCDLSGSLASGEIAPEGGQGLRVKGFFSPGNWAIIQRMGSEIRKTKLDYALKIPQLHEAAIDFRYLLNRAYPRKPSLELVGNHYQLTFDERHLLHRAVFSDGDARKRLKKKVSPQKISGQELAIDGYNVVITIEAALSGRPLVFGDDGFLRDISGLSGNFRRTRRTEESLRLIFAFLTERKPRRTMFLFDSPISNSGTLAQEVRRYLQEMDIPGDAKAVRVPEDILIGFPGIVATSDTAIIDQSSKIVDLAGFLIRQRVPSAPILQFKKRGFRPIRE